MSSLDKFREIVNDISDEKMLEVAEGMLKDMVAIENMKQKIEMLEDGLHKNGRAAFWFFAMGLNEEEIDLAAGIVVGRKRFIKEKADRAQMSKDVADGKYDAVEPEVCSVEEFEKDMEEALNVMHPDLNIENNSSVN